MEASKSNQPVPGKYFLLMPDTTRGGKGHGVVFENAKRLRIPPRLILRPEEGGFPPMAEKPLLVYSAKKGSHPEDLEGGMSGYWMVSERLRGALVSVDPAGFEFVECDYRLADGSKGPRYFLCDVTRELDAVDEEASKFRIITDAGYRGGKFYDLRGGASLAFRKQVIGQARIFRTPYSGNLVFCDRELRDAVWNAGICGPRASRGLWFTDAASI
ncbi:DUF1629 domain-containing protein [Stenotrophomonas maltophilia]|uniref:DUF1629 domain-containing protein n=1 Tax=Stenotrophomonas maltophilia TaxID=40324 RepID=A0A6B8IYV6_STEMA|nr:DUF1629 domain-containing protein [Stenotrophomonas maltophilia]MBH1652383.1 DUF1629 domain-containing protein [Stenotrophomonas maltophilia]QGL99634.1 DUF1629 domain-containing protein [Stenotrophomonas maltophilia]HDS1510160.1 DUF1629 domain-containing protein [Stenotrophomonas maltophilia]